MNAINCTVSAEEYLNTSSMGSSEIMRNINEENTLIEKRTEALLLEDKNAYNYYNDEIKKQGMKEISIQEILELTGEKNQSSPVANAGSRSDVRFECKKYSYKYSDGKTYSVMKITATPTGEGLLYKTGSTTIKNSSSSLRFGNSCGPPCAEVIMLQPKSTELLCGTIS